MDIKIELLVRVFMAICLFIMLAKVFGKTLQNFIATYLFNKQNKKNTDIDYLIATQKEILGSNLRSQSPDSYELKSTQKSNNPQRSKTEREYSKYYQKNPINKHEVRPVFNLFDNAKWGEGPKFKNIQHKMQTLHGFEVEMEHISKSVNFLIKNNTFISLNKPELPSYSEVEELIICRIILELLIKEAITESNQLLSKLSKKSKFKIANLSLALEFILIKNLNSNIQSGEIYLSILNPANKLVKQHSISNISPEEIIESSLKMLITENKKKFLTPHKLFSKIFQEASIFEMLEPLPQLQSEKDSKTAFLILNASPASSFNDIKRKYKKLALLKHPDRIESYNLPDELVKVANENFSKLQRAFEILKKSKKN